MSIFTSAEAKENLENGMCGFDRRSAFLRNLSAPYMLSDPDSRDRNCPHDNDHCKPAVNVPHSKIRVLAGLSVRRDRRIERRE